MNHLLRPFVGAVLLAALGICRESPAQGQGDKALRRARVIEEQEGDLQAAEKAYRALVDDAGTAAGVRNDAMLRLGRMLWRLGRQDDARALLQKVQQAGGEAGKEAAAILQGQGPEAEAAAEVAARARDAIARLLQEKTETGNARQDLEWLGVAAMPEVLRQLQERRGRAMQAAAHLSIQNVDYLQSAPAGSPQFQITGNQDQDAIARERLLAEFAWRADGAEVERFLRAALADEDVQWRRIVTSSSEAANDALLPLVAQLLDDKDPDGIVPGLALRSAGRLPLPAVVGALGAPVASVRSRAWFAVGALNLWSQSPQEPKNEAVRLLEPHLLKALNDPDPKTARSGLAFLQGGAATTTRGAELLLDWLPRVPVFDVRYGLQARPPLSLIVRTAKVLGRFGTPDGKDNRRTFLAQLANPPIKDDRQTTAGQICDLVELGYDRALGAPWLVFAARIARDEAEFVRIAGLLDTCIRPEDAEQTLATREGDLPAAMLPALEKRLEGVVPATRPFAKEQPLTEAEKRISNEVFALFRVIGRTRSADAVPFLRQHLEARPFLASGITEAALSIAERSQANQVGEFLRELLISKSIDDPHQRNRVFAALAKLGDVDAIPLYPKAYEMGLDYWNDPGISISVNGVGWLAMLPESTSVTPRPLRKWHGYDERHLTDAWQTLLASPVMPRVLMDVANLQWSVDLSDGPRLQLAELLAGKLPELLGYFREPTPRGQGPSGPQRDVLLALLRWVAAKTPAGQDEPSQRYRTAVAKLLGNEEVAGQVATGIAKEAMPLLADAIRPLLAGPSSLVVMQAMRQAGVTLSTADLLACLRSQSENRSLFLSELPPDMPQEIVREVEKMTRDPAATVRAEACAALGRTLLPDVVAVLLPALRDPAGNVAKAASDALQVIRHYQEQRAFWDQFQQGVTTGREAATAKLLIQSKPGANKEQRLLALRSLGALGAPEALPYLIEWSQEQDADVAAACKAAIARIHQQAGVK